MTALRIFVRRGAIRRFHRLTRDAEGLPVSVEWDRRQRERRTEEPDSSPTEQRRSDRRADPPFTWDAAEFVVVNDPSEKA
jgi:hypothetical protein